MTLAEAFEKTFDGFTVRREAWPSGMVLVHNFYSLGEYLIHDETQVGKRGLGQPRGGEHFHFTAQDVAATDWEVIEDAS
jgi:hypothetical protein